MKCPNCEKEVFGGCHDVDDFYKEPKELTPIEKLQEENEQTLDDLASHIVLCSDLKIENKQLREEIQFLIGGFRVAGWEIKKAGCVPIGQMWINSNYDLGV